MESKTDRQLPIRSRGYVMSILRQIHDAAIRVVNLTLSVFLISTVAGIGFVGGVTIGIYYIVLGAGA